MDSNRAAEDFFEAHPDWFARDADGQPYRAADKYVACINSPYYDEYLPGVLREIIERSRPDGFTDNSWAGSAARASATATTARASSGDERHAAAAAGRLGRPGLPRLDRVELRAPDRGVGAEQSHDARRGGPDCIWIGMNSGSVTAQARSFRDLKAICERAEIMMLDHQRRDDDTGFQQNGDAGKRVHTLLGWDKLIPESMAMYQSGPGDFRVASKPAAEARMWVIEGFAGGIQPWWHHVGAYHEDRRKYRSAEPLLRWRKANEQYLVNRTPVANVGVVWSQRNIDFYGRDAAAEVVDAPYTGFMHALVRARIPYLPIHADHIDRDAAGLTVLILPNVGALSDASGGGDPPLRGARRLAVRHRARRASTTNGATRGPTSRSPTSSAVTVAATTPRRADGRARRRPTRSGRLRRARAATPTCASRRNCARASTDREAATSRRSPAHVTRCCVASTRPTCCRSAAR